jgi:GH25 family lysozyme M1 (1,4-beta-N-acetylmuramidase)
MDWPLLRSLGYSFAYVRGVKMGRELDVHAVEHVTRARAAGFRVGLYLFFDPRHSVEQQVQLAADAHAACGMHPGDLAPALDVESIDGGPEAGTSWVPWVTDILDGLTAAHGAALRYHNVADWYAMGMPSALERWPLWLADYTPPADLPCVCWQQRSAPIAGYGSTKLDQNVALGDLPTIGPRDDVLEVVEPSTLPEEIAIPWVRWDRAEHDRLRNAAVARNTEREPL